MHQPSKIGEMDESVTLDMEFLQWMKPLLKTLKSKHLPRRPCVRLLPRQSQQVVQSGSGPSEISPSGDSVPVSNPTRCCINRSSVSQKAARRGHEERAMEDTGVSEKIRTGRQTRSGVRVALRGPSRKNAWKPKAIQQVSCFALLDAKFPAWLTFLGTLCR